MGFITNSNTGALTNSLLNNASGLTAYAQGRVTVVDRFIDSLTNAVLTLSPPPITPIFPDGASAPAVDIPTPPEFSTPVWTAPGFPKELAAILDVSDLEIGTFDDNPPVINYGTAPTANFGEMPDAPTVNLDYKDPELSITLPQRPNLLSLDVRKFSGLNLPTFDAADPVLTAIEPSVVPYQPGAQYTSALLTGLKRTLEDRITTGGTGLTQEVENAIWDRGREREARSYADSVAQLDEMEGLGYSFPPGAFLAARAKIITEMDYVNRGHSREVMIKSAELMLDNVKHALTTSVQLEGQLIDYNNAVEQRLFESARYATEAGVSIYNAKVQAYGAMVDAYRAKVGVYEARIRAEVSRVDAYRAEIAAEEAKASINRALVDQYKAEIEAALSGIEIYKAEIAGIQAKAEIERTKVMIFGEQVRGYTAQINAYTAGVEGFRATVQAEQTKQQVYQSQIEAFTARVNAQSRIIDTRIEAYKGAIAGKTAEYDGYRAAVAGESARVDAIAKTNGVLADAYKSRVEAAGTYNEVLTKQWAATLDQNARISDIGINAAKANAELYISSRSLALEAAKTGAQVAAQIGSAALNAVNFSGSVSSSQSYGESNNASVSDSTSSSNSTGTSTSYNYNTSV
jgi:hypothetical protein